MLTGDSSSGKSTLINILLGLNLLPVSPKPCTSTICEVRYGDDFRVEVFFKNSSETKIIPDVTNENVVEKLRPYLSIDGDERYNVNPYLKVVLHWPLDILKVLFVSAGPLVNF